MTFLNSAHSNAHAQPVTGQRSLAVSQHSSQPVYGMCEQWGFWRDCANVPIYDKHHSCTWCDSSNEAWALDTQCRKLTSDESTCSSSRGRNTRDISCNNFTSEQILGFTVCILVHRSQRKKERSCLKENKCFPRANTFLLPLPLSVHSL